MKELSARYPVWLCDVWGVVHDGHHPIAPAVTALERHRANGGQVILITNAPRPMATIQAFIDHLGVARDAYDAMVTSGDVTRDLMLHQAGHAVYHLGPGKDLPLFDGLDVRRVPLADLNRSLNASVIVQVLIETPAGIDNIDAIAAVEGVDLIAIGTNDLSAEFGAPGDHAHPRVRQAHRHAIERCRVADKPIMIGGIGDPAYVAELVSLGAVPLLMSGSDGELLRSGAQQAAQRALQALRPAS